MAAEVAYVTITAISVSRDIVNGEITDNYIPYTLTIDKTLAIGYGEYVNLSAEVDPEKSTLFITGMANFIVVDMTYTELGDIINPAE